MFFEIARKYWQFLQVSMGVWTDELCALHSVEEHVSRMTVIAARPGTAGASAGSPSVGGDSAAGQSTGKLESPRDMSATNKAYSNCLSSIISTRVVLLQVVPQFTMLAVYAIATASAPLFVNPSCSLYGNLYPPIIRDPFARARQAETDKYKDTTWWVPSRAALPSFSPSLLLSFSPPSSARSSVSFRVSFSPL